MTSNTNFIEQTLRLLRQVEEKSSPILRQFESESKILFGPSTQSVCIRPEYEHCDPSQFPTEEEIEAIRAVNDVRKSQIYSSAVGPGNAMDYSLQLIPLSFLRFIACNLKYNCANPPSSRISEFIRTVKLQKRIGAASLFGSVYTTRVPIPLTGNPSVPGTFQNILGFLSNILPFMSSVTQIQSQGRLSLGDAAVAKLMRADSEEESDELPVNALHELVVGLVAVNTLRDTLPTLMYTYGFLQCSDVQGCVLPVFRTKSFAPEQVNYPVLLLEFIDQARSLSSRVVDMTRRNFVSVVSQITISMGKAYRRVGLIHQDLHDGNVLLQRLDTLVVDLKTGTPLSAGRSAQQTGAVSQRFWIEFTSTSESREKSPPEFYVQVQDYLARIIDYGLSTIRINNRTFSHWVLLYGELDQANFVSDIVRLIGFNTYRSRGEGDKTRFKLDSVRVTSFMYNSLFRYCSSVIPNYLHGTRGSRRSTTARRPSSTTPMISVRMTRQQVRQLELEQTTESPEEQKLRVFLGLLWAQSRYCLYYGDVRQSVDRPERKELPVEVLGNLTELLENYLYLLAMYEWESGHIATVDPEKTFSLFDLVSYFSPAVLYGVRNLHNALIEFSERKFTGPIVEDKNQGTARKSSKAIHLSSSRSIPEFVEIAATTNVLPIILERMQLSGDANEKIDSELLHPIHTDLLHFINTVLPDVSTFISQVLFDRTNDIDNISTLFRSTILSADMFDANDPSNIILNR